MDTTPALYLCTRPQKHNPSAHQREDELLQTTKFSASATVEVRLSHPRRHPWNSHHQHNRVIDHLVNEQQLWNPMITRTMGINQSLHHNSELLPTTKGTQREVQFHQQTSNGHATAEKTTSAATSSSAMCAGRNENHQGIQSSTFT